ncbi:MAG: recombinase family protein [Senegalimassilia anaerobia]
MARKSRKACVAAADAVPAAPEARVWRCAVYARLSNRNNGREDDDSLQAQVVFVRDSVAGMPDVEVVGVYADNGRTGTTFEGRHEFEALMDEVRAGGVDCIVVKDLSRFGRNMYETSTYLERIFPFLGVRFIAVNDGLDTLQGDGGIVVPFKGLVNEMYAVETSRKVSAVKHRQMEEGEVIYGNTCYGYRVVRGEGRLDVDDATAPFVPLAFSMFLDGERLVDIAAALAEMGAPTPVDHLDAQSSAGYAGAWRDRPWSARYVAKTLDNPVYVGTLVLGNTYRSLCDGVPAHTVPEGERLVFPDAHPALVTAEVFGRVRAKRRAQKAAKRAQVAAKEADRNAMPDELAGVLFCAECGGRMILDRRFNPKTGEARGSVYKCRRHHGRGCGNDVRVAERALRIAVMDEVRVQVSMALEFDRVLPGLRGSEGAVEERRRLQASADALVARAAALSRERQRLYELYACGGVTLAEYKKMQVEADGRAVDCQAALDAANRELADFDALLVSDGAFKEAVAALEDLFTFSRDLVLALVRRIEVSRDGGIEIQFRFGDWRDRVASIERRLA